MPFPGYYDLLIITIHLKICYPLPLMLRLLSHSIMTLLAAFYNFVFEM